MEEENTYGGYVAASLTAHITHSSIPPESASSGSLRMYGVYVLRILRTVWKECLAGVRSANNRGKSDWQGRKRCGQA